MWGWYRRATSVFWESFRIRLGKEENKKDIGGMEMTMAIGYLATAGIFRGKRGQIEKRSGQELKETREGGVNERYQASSRHSASIPESIRKFNKS